MASKNYESKIIQTKDGAIKYGHIHQDDVKSSLLLQGQESLEYISFDQTEPRKRWLSNRCRGRYQVCLLYTSPSPRDRQKSRMPSSA